MTSDRLVYTAQSKQYFYCRDAVCEYVFNRGAVPLNPFRAFDYFLGDRVPRAQIRVANRRLLEASDEVWIFGEQLADGVLIEIAQAMELGKPLRYFTIDNQADQIEEVEPQRLDFEAQVSKETGLEREQLLGHLMAGTTRQVVQALGRHSEVRGSR